MELSVFFIASFLVFERSGAGREGGWRALGQTTRPLYRPTRLLALLIQERKWPKSNGENRAPGLK